MTLDPKLPFLSPSLAAGRFKKKKNKKKNPTQMHPSSLLMLTETKFGWLFAHLQALNTASSLQTVSRHKSPISSETNILKRTYEHDRCMQYTGKRTSDNT